MTYHSELGAHEPGHVDMTFTTADVAEENYRAGIAALRASPPQNTEALRLLSLAYRAEPNPRGLIAIGIAMQRLKRFSEAKARFQRYLREEPEGSFAARARRGVAETQAAIEGSRSTEPKPPPGDMDAAAYAAARSRTPDQIAAGTGLPPPTLRAAALGTGAVVAIGIVAVLGLSGIIWAVTRRR